MSKVRINDLARELEVKSKSILDALTAVGVTEKKTHSSSIEEDEAAKVRGHLTGGRSASRGSAPASGDNKPKFDLSQASKPGDVARALIARRQAEQSPPPPMRPAVVAAPPPERPVVVAVAPPRVEEPVRPAPVV